MSRAHGRVKQEHLHTSHSMVTPLLDFSSIDHRKPLSGLVESYYKVVEHGRRIAVPVAFESSGEAASVMKDVYVELELVRLQMGFDAFGQTRGRIVSAFLSLCDQ